MKPLVLVSGLAMRSNEYAELARDFDPRLTYMFDNPCVGHGPRPLGGLTIEDQANHQWQQIEREYGSGRVHLFGLSMGGMIASSMASMKPHQVASLTVAATSPNVIGEAEAIPAELEKAWLAARSKEELASAVDIAFGKSTKKFRPNVRDSYFHYRASGENQQAHRDFSKQLSSIRGFNGAATYEQCRQIPSLVIAGEEDELFPLPHSNLIGCLSDSNVEVIAKAGHMLHLEAPTELAEIVSRFISSVEQSGAR